MTLAQEVERLRAENAELWQRLAAGAGENAGLRQHLALALERCPDCRYRLSGESIDYTREVGDATQPGVERRRDCGVSA